MALNYTGGVDLSIRIEEGKCHVFSSSLKSFCKTMKLISVKQPYIKLHDKG